MKIIQCRNGKYYLNKREILNYYDVKDYADIILSEEETSIWESEKDSQYILESYKEVVDKLTGCYCARLKLFSDFKKSTRYIWVNLDAGLPTVVKKIGMNKCFLDRWNYPGWHLVRKEIEEMGIRRYVVREEDMIRMRDELVLQGMM